METQQPTPKDVVYIKVDGVTVEISENWVRPIDGDIGLIFKLKP